MLSAIARSSRHRRAFARGVVGPFPREFLWTEADSLVVLLGVDVGVLCVGLGGMMVSYWAVIGYL